MKKGIVVLDIDGTLTDTIPQHQHAFKSAMESLNLRELNTDWASYPSHTDTGIYEYVLRQNGFPIEVEARKAFEKDVQARFMQSVVGNPVREIQGAASFLSQLRLSDWIPVFATGGIRGVSLCKLEALGVSDLSDRLVTSTEYADRTELVAAAIRLAMEKFDLGSHVSIVSVGDGKWDFEVARSLEVGFLGVGTGPSAAWLLEQGAHVIPDLTDGLSALDAASTPSLINAAEILS